MKFRLMVILCSVGNYLGAFEIMIPENQDMAIYTDRQPNPYTFFNPYITSGDYNGDGNNDLVVPYNLLGHQQGFSIFFGPSWENSDTYSNRVGVQIIVPPSSFSSNPPFLADLDGDHKEELIFYNFNTNWPGGGVNVCLVIIKGRESGENNYIDLNVTDPELIVNLSGGGYWTGLSVGDVDGDAYSDFVICNPLETPMGRTEAGACYVFFGRPSLPSGTVDIHSDSRTSILLGKTNDRLGSKVYTADLDQNGKADIILDGNIFYGTTNFPSTWDLVSTPADVRIQGGITYIPLGDMNGDRKAEFLVISGASGESYSLLDGQWFTTDMALMDITPGSHSFVPTVPISWPPLDARSRWTKISVGDFDGDQLADLFIPDLVDSQPVVYGVFSSALGTGPLVAISTPSAIFQFPGENFTGGILKDINNDGHDDFLSNEISPFPRPPANSWSAVRAVFGFAPLTNPFVKIIPRDPHSLRVGLNLTVDGNPTEMMISGDISDSLSGLWIPYQESLTVTLTTSPGTKTIQAKFRNSYLRESDLTQDTWGVSAESGHVTVVTNRLERNSDQKARFEFQISEPVSVEAGVYDTNGARVRNLFQADAPKGVLVVEWDGDNDAGRRVVPGVYYLVTKINGRTERHKIAVRG